MAKRCRTALYLNYQREYCRYMSATYDMMEATLEYMLQQPKLKKKKCAIVLDIDATVQSEDEFTGREIWTKAINFIKSTKAMYKSKITLFFVTARPSDYGIINDFGERGVTFGKNKDIEFVYYDDQNIGTMHSKIQNRQIIRDIGYTIIASIGDNITDLVFEDETDGFSRTANFLLPNIYRHEYT